MNSLKQIDSDLEEYIIFLYAECGLEISNISFVTNTNIDIIDSILKDNGTQQGLPYSVNENLNNNDIVELYLIENITVNAVSKRIEQAPSSIRKRIYKMKIKKPKDKVRESELKSNVEKYGVKYPSALPEIQCKREKTCLERYGATTNLATKENQEKSKETCKKKYGVEYVSQSEEFKEKSRKTCLDKYGVDNPSKSPEIIDKIQKVIHERHGEHPFAKDGELSKKRIKSLEEKYGKGVTHHSLINIHNLDEWNNFYNWVMREFNKLGKRIEKVNAASYFNVTIGSINKKIRETNTQEFFTVALSSYEKEWCDFLESNNIKYELHVRNIINGEIDIYLVDYGIGLEINPSSSHNSTLCVYAPEKGKPKSITYHRDKSMEAIKKGINLIHIFDWTDKSAVKKYLEARIEKQINIGTSIKDLKEKKYIRYHDINTDTVISFVSDKISGNWTVECSLFIPEHIMKYVINDFIKQYDPSRIIFEADMACINIPLLIELGFIAKTYIEPICRWVNIFHYDENVIIDDNTIIPEEMINKGYGRVYDSGKAKMIFRKQ